MPCRFGFARPPSGGQALVDFYHQHRDAIRWREFLSGLALVFLLPFVAALRSALRREEDERSWVSAAAFAGAGVTAAGALTVTLARVPPDEQFDWPWINTRRGSRGCWRA